MADCSHPSWGNDKLTRDSNYTCGTCEEGYEYINTLGEITCLINCEFFEFDENH